MKKHDLYIWPAHALVKVKTMNCKYITKHDLLSVGRRSVNLRFKFDNVLIIIGYRDLTKGLEMWFYQNDLWLWLKENQNGLKMTVMGNYAKLATIDFNTPSNFL